MVCKLGIDSKTEITKLFVCGGSLISLHCVRVHWLEETSQYLSRLDQMWQRRRSW